MHREGACGLPIWVTLASPHPEILNLGHVLGTNLPIFQDFPPHLWIPGWSSSTPNSLVQIPLVNMARGPLPLDSLPEPWITGAVGACFSTNKHLR